MLLVQTTTPRARQAMPMIAAVLRPLAPNLALAVVRADSWLVQEAKDAGVIWKTWKT